MRQSKRLPGAAIYTIPAYWLKMEKGAMTPEQIERQLDRVLLSVDKPGRYVGGEYNSVVKDWNNIPFRAALAFPDIYDLGMSNLGLMLLYGILNDQPDMLAERVFSPWLDMEEVM